MTLRYPAAVAIAVAFALSSADDGRAQQAQNDGSVLLPARSLPVPETMSPEGRASMIQPSFPTVPRALPERREVMRQLGVKRAEAFAATYKVNVERTTIDGVKVAIVTPQDIPPGKRDRVLIHLHWGGFSVCDDICSYTEAMPIAGLARTKVISVDYSLAPEHPFPAAVSETVKVYRYLLKTYRPNRIGVFGSSAGAILSGQAVAAFKAARLPMPAAMGYFSGTADFARKGDSESLFSVSGFAEPKAKIPQISDYLQAADPRDPLASPIYADLRGFPPTLLMTSTRDVFLSGTSNFERALHAAGTRTELVVYDGFPHTFWLGADVPEAHEALERQAQFFDRELGRSK